MTRGHDEGSMISVYRLRVVLFRTGTLADDKLAFRLIEVVYRNFEVELEGNEAYAKPTGNGELTGAGPLRIRPAGEKGDALAIGGSSAKLLKTRTDIVMGTMARAEPAARKW